VLLSEKEWGNLEKLAEQRQQTLSEVMRELLRKEICSEFGGFI
jgi:uncharacterized circularly permuted ATP-grasp superfamily protein